MNKYNRFLLHASFYHAESVYLFQIENLHLLFINLLLMIQFYIPWEGEGGAMMKI
jgi:hypothetical protein